MTTSVFGIYRLLANFIDPVINNCENVERGKMCMASATFVTVESIQMEYSFTTLTYK